MAEKAIVNPEINVNNETVFIIPNSGAYTEGLGEQKVSTLSAGDQIEVVVEDDAETKKSMVKFNLKNTQNHIALARSWKSNPGANGIIIQDNDGFSRTFQSMTLINNYEVALGSDKDIPIEFEGEPAV